MKFAANGFYTAESGGKKARRGPFGVLSAEEVKAPGGDHLRVLIVDDEPDLADVTGALLGMHGVEVVVAYSGADALRILAEDSRIDAVFSDVMMPGMTGLDLAKIVERQYPHINVVLASGFVERNLQPNFALSYAFIAKPYRIEVVLELLRTKPM